MPFGPHVLVTRAWTGRAFPCSSVSATVLKLDQTKKRFQYEAALMPMVEKVRSAEAQIGSAQVISRGLASAASEDEYKAAISVIERSTEVFDQATRLAHPIARSAPMVWSKAVETEKAEKAARIRSAHPKLSGWDSGRSWAPWLAAGAVLFLVTR